MRAMQAAEPYQAPGVHMFNEPDPLGRGMLAAPHPVADQSVMQAWAYCAELGLQSISSAAFNASG